MVHNDRRKRSRLDARNEVGRRGDTLNDQTRVRGGLKDEIRERIRTEEENVSRIHDSELP